jgi:hypothetical protein
MQLHRHNAHVSAGSRLLRRTIPLAIATALVAIAGLTLSATLTASDGKGQGECNVATLRGRYLFADSGTLLPPAFGVTVPTPASDAGSDIFNGDGTGTATVTVRIGTTVVLENFVTPFTYTVNADCTGSQTVTNGPTFGLFIAPDGEEFAAIATDPPGNYPSSIHRRVARH